MLECKYLIVGSGQTGLLLAKELCKLEKKVILVEQSELGGTYFNSLDIPKEILTQESNQFASSLELFKSFPETFSILRKHRQKIHSKILNKTKKQKTELIAELETFPNFQFLEGTAEFVSKSMMEVNSESERHLVTYEMCLLATGKNNMHRPELKGLNEIDFLFQHNSFLFEQIPTKLAIVGVSSHSLEIASIYASLGVKVAMFEERETKKVLNKIDRTAFNHILQSLASRQVSFVFDTKIVEVKKLEKGLQLIDSDKKEHEFSHLCFYAKETFEDDTLKLSKLDIKHTTKGIATNGFGRTSHKHIWAFGECASCSNPENKTALIFDFIKTEQKNTESSKSKLPLLDAATNYFSEKEVNNLNVKTHKISIFSPICNVGLSEHEALSIYGSTIKHEIISHFSKDGFVKIVFQENTNQVVGVILAGDFCIHLEEYVILSIKIGIKLKQIRNYIYTRFGF